MLVNLLIYFQRSPLSSSLVMKQQGTLSDILQLEFTNSESWRSVTMSWALFSLSQNKHAQTKLREEISNISTDNPTMDDLNGLPYMDAVVRETLRLHPPVPGLLREAGKDDCIPLSKPFTDKKGIVRNEIR
jgi:Cytochrome P450